MQGVQTGALWWGPLPCYVEFPSHWARLFTAGCLFLCPHCHVRSLYPHAVSMLVPYWVQAFLWSTHLEMGHLFIVLVHLWKLRGHRTPVFRHPPCYQMVRNHFFVNCCFGSRPHPHSLEVQCVIPPPTLDHHLNVCPCFAVRTRAAFIRVFPNWYPSQCLPLQPVHTG